MERFPSQPASYARVLRLVAVALALLALAKQLTGDFPSAAAQRDLLIVRATASAIAVVIALLCSPGRPILHLRTLAFALGLDGVVLSLGAAIIVPTDVWEQAASLVGLLFGAAIFMPWSWRWQAVFAGITMAATTVAFAVVIREDALMGHTAARVLVTLYVMAAISVLGADLADRLRRQIEASQAEIRAHDTRRLHEQRLDALSRFAGGIAHQFNNLLGGILTHIEVLRHDQGVRGEDAPDALDEVASAARRGRDLTEELLRFTRANPLTLRPIDPGQVLASVAQLARATLGDGATVEVLAPPPGELPPIAADIDHLVHACTQTVLNARDAMRGRPSPRLTISAAAETVAQGAPLWPDADPGRYVRISLADSGRGMDQATLERVFDPFFTTKPMHQAKGLGLAMVHRVIHEHGGAVRVESAIGQGTTVHLLLPVSTEPLPIPATPAQSPAPRSPLPAPASSATILVVDDEPIVRNSLKRALTRFGHRVLEAADGGTALTALQTADPPVDLVILDLVLPGGGAGIFELLKAVRPELKVIVSSGYSPDGVAAQGLAAKVEGFLPKPYELKQLREAVSKALAGER
jgi:signal transduction histidine kinase/CheY-like chemotaxis protein